LVLVRRVRKWFADRLLNGFHGWYEPRIGHNRSSLRAVRLRCRWKKGASMRRSLHPHLFASEAVPFARRLMVLEGECTDFGRGVRAEFHCQSTHFECLHHAKWMIGSSRILMGARGCERKIEPRFDSW
jgi:hypothetical protein